MINRPLGKLFIRLEIDVFLYLCKKLHVKTLGYYEAASMTICFSSYIQNNISNYI